jgi:hypothetical protein
MVRDKFHKGGGADYCGKTLQKIYGATTPAMSLPERAITAERTVIPVEMDITCLLNASSSTFPEFQVIKSLSKNETSHGYYY